MSRLFNRTISIKAGYTASYLAVFLIAFFSHLSTAGDCAALNCDCGNIPNQPLQGACQAHERLLRESCPDVQKNVRGYCGIHGPSAFPVAVTLDVSPVEPSPDVGASDRRIASLYWSIRQDANFASESLKLGALGEANAILKISRRNMDSLLNSQLEVARAWEKKKSDRRVVNAWKKYSEDTYSLAKHWSKLLKKSDAALTKAAKQADTAPEQLESLLLIRKSVSELVALSYEQAGYAYAGAKKYGLAAKAWKAAAEQSTDLIALLVDHGQKATVGTYKDQSAARFHRASLYWLMNEGGNDDEEELAQQAVEFASDQLLQQLLTDK